MPSTVLLTKSQRDRREEMRLRILKVSMINIYISNKFYIGLYKFHYRESRDESIVQVDRR